MFTALGATKFVVSGIVGMGTKRVVSAIINNHVVPVNPLDKVTITAATWVIAAMATAATKKFADETVDDCVKVFTETYGAVNLAMKLDRINRQGSTFQDEGLDSKNFTKDAKTGKWILKETIEGEVVDETVHPEPSTTSA